MMLNTRYKIPNTKNGFTIIEALVFLFIFVVSVLTMYAAFNAAMINIIETKKKLAAISLADEQLEKIMNLGYANIAEGATVDVEIVKNGIRFLVTTNIVADDDAADGLGIADDVNWDYKKIQIDVRWNEANPQKKISMSTIVVPPIREEDAAKGFMTAYLIDQNGNGLSGASIEVIRIADNSLIYSGNVDSNGNKFLTGLEIGQYKIKVKSTGGLYAVETMDSSANFSPTDEHVDILAKTAAERTIQTDKTSTLDVDIKDVFGNLVPNLGFSMAGGKILGKDKISNNFIYGYSAPTSSSDGSESFSSFSFGPYYFNFTDLTNQDTSTDYEFLWMEPSSDLRDKIMLNAGTTLDATAVVAPKNLPLLLVTTNDNGTGKPVAGATIHLTYDNPPGDPIEYEEEKTTNVFGQAIFTGNVGVGLSNVQYNLDISATGYADKDDTVNVNNYTTKTINLSP